MNKNHKEKIRSFLMNRLYCGGGDFMQDLFEVLDANGIDRDKGQEFAEAQVGRVDKLFGHPEIR